MSRRVVLTGLGLVALGLGIFAWKTLVLGLPVVPSQPVGLWQVELELAVRGRGETGSVRVALPVVRPGQRIFGEWSSADDLRYSVREEDDRRIGVWSGWMEDVHLVDYVFRVERYPDEAPAVDRAPGEPPRSLRLRYTRPEVTLPVSAPPVRDFVRDLDLPPPEDRAGRARTLYAFVRHEVQEVPSASADAILALVQREGSERGRARLFVTLLRAVGMPARVVPGFELREGRARTRVWAEIWWDGDWLPVSPSAGFFGELPLDWVALSPGDSPIVESTGVRAVSYTARALREHLTVGEIGAMMLPGDPVFGPLSLYRLSVSKQAALRILLVLPLAALLIGVLRNVIGVTSYGTFMPMLLAMALRGTGLLPGLALVALVIGLGIAGRLLLDRLKLLLVPRLAILLCVVILCVTGFALLGRGLDERDFYAGIVFPIVILTMLIERFSVAMTEEGLQEALARAGWSTLMAVAIYPLFRLPTLAHVMFGFPELVLCVIGLLVLLGGYTGYRLSDWVRFRLLARRIADEASS